MKKRYKIGFVHPDLGIGGAERLILDMANSLSENNEVIFLTNHFDSKHAFDELKGDQYRVLVYADWMPRSIFGRCRALCAYLRMIYLVLAFLLFHKKKEKIDLFIVDLIPIAVPFLKLGGERVIYYCHHPDLLSTSREHLLKKLYRIPIDWIEYKATSSSDITLVNSKYTASIFRETFPNINIKLQVLYPTISSSLIELISSNKNYDSDSQSVNSLIGDDSHNWFVYLSINRFHPAKNLEVAIEAMAQLKTNLVKSKWDQIHLIIAGGYDSRSEINSNYYITLKELTSKLGLNEKITFMKSPSDEMKIKLLQRCNCLVYTPTKEHFGIVPLEAMMAKKPVIACNSGGPRETVESGENGLLFEPDASSLAKCMENMMDEETSKKMGVKGYQRLFDMFSNELFSKQMNDIVKNAIEN